MAATLKEIKKLRDIMREMINEISDAENSDTETEPEKKKQVDKVIETEKKQASNVKSKPLYNIGHLAKYT